MVTRGEDRVVELLLALRDSQTVSLRVPSGHHVEVGARRSPPLAYIYGVLLELVVYLSSKHDCVRMCKCSPRNKRKSGVNMSFEVRAGMSCGKLQEQIVSACGRHILRA